MKGRIGVLLEIYRRFLGLKEKFPCTTDAKTIVRGFCSATYFYGVLMKNVFVGLGIARCIVYIPSKSTK